MIQINDRRVSTVLYADVHGEIHELYCDQHALFDVMDIWYSYYRHA